MFKKILIANRGEIALRIVRACKDMGIASVAVHSTVDAEAMHVRLADQSVCIGPSAAKESYTHIPSILAACDITGAEAVHPGYGFLSENAPFADIITEHGLTFIGPSAEHMRLMGDKITAKQTARALGLPCVPGSDGSLTDADSALALAREIGFPVLIKAAAGGGGRGMRPALTEDAFVEAYTAARRDAAMLYSDDSVYLEKYLRAPRHIEIQVFGDTHGNAVHLGERDCSLQRRHQKVLEESPSPALTPEQRAHIGTLAATAVRRLGYVGAGTMEFLFENGEFYFIEMNTRIQVEHPITEAVTGIDLIREQICVAAGQPLSFAQSDVVMRGHAIECRVNAEDPRTFVPCPGKIGAFHTPGGPSVRVDSGAFAGYTVPPHYDSLIAKLIVHAEDRPAALRRLQRALGEFVVGGIKTTLPLFVDLCKDDAFIAGEYDIKWLENQFLAESPK